MVSSPRHIRRSFTGRSEQFVTRFCIVTASSSQPLRRASGVKAKACASHFDKHGCAQKLVQAVAGSAAFGPVAADAATQDLGGSVPDRAAFATTRLRVTHCAQRGMFACGDSACVRTAPVVEAAALSRVQHRKIAADSCTPSDCLPVGVAALPPPKTPITRLTRGCTFVRSASASVRLPTSRDRWSMETPVERIRLRLHWGGHLEQEPAPAGAVEFKVR
eukprot:100385-Chlamydomonas_euryale.AAC.11